MKKEILEGNELIADYMDDSGEFAKKKTRAGCIESLYYHDQWDTLMEAVEYVEYHSKPKVRFVMYPNECVVQELQWDGEFKYMLNHMSFNRKETVYYVLVSYLKKRKKLEVPA